MPYVPRAELEALRDALKAFLESYLRLIDSGDCGNWEPRDEKEVKASTAALFALESRLAETGEEEIPLARLLHWNGPAHMSVPHDGLAARTFAEFSKETPDKDRYWTEGAPLYTRPTPRVSPCPECEWQPIETAPKDGTLVLLLLAKDAHLECCIEGEEDYAPRTIGHYDFNREMWQFAGWDWTNDIYTEGCGTPTYWMPLPAAPQLPEGETP